MHTVAFYREEFNEHLKSSFEAREPKGLYDPIAYILDLGGKRLRPVLTLMATELFGGSYKEALNAGMAIEIFHNFSLIHDDIMDAAPLRRGKITVHEKWNTNTGILSGDAMLIMAYQYFEQYEGETYKDLMELFSKTAIEVCEGQQYDMDFEERNDVVLIEYLKMITYKTAVLVAASLKMGAIIMGANETDRAGIYEFGKNLGIAFQLQDDYLDAFGNPETFGKQLGGDIIENKKTYLYLKAIENADASQLRKLEDLFTSSQADPHEKVREVKQIFRDTGVVEIVKKEIENYTKKAFQNLERLSASEENKKSLKDFGQNLMKREI